MAACLVTGILQIAWGDLRLAHQMPFAPQAVLVPLVEMWPARIDGDAGAPSLVG